jgi:UDPglucose 6-dehydrogenase
MRIAMIGTGYVGLVSGACLADYGYQVTCVDKDGGKVESLRRGEIPIFEPGLEALVASNVKAGRLDFTTDLAGPVAEADAVFIAVGTPSRRGDGHADLSYVYSAAREIAAALTGFTVVVTKSTVPVGTGDEVERLIREANPSADVVIASNPEFLREGAAIRDFKFPDRIVIGTSDERAKKVLGDIYRPLSLNQAPLMFTARRTAELIKYAANAFLATKITFINEIADLSEKVGADIQEVARGIGLDNRIGSKFLHAGPGFGGSCFPKDTRALVKTALDHDVQLRIVESVLAVNDNRKRAMARKVASASGGSLRGKTIAVLGLTFKPDTDDMREAPSIPLVTGLLDMGARVRAHDPVGIEQARRELPDIEYCDDPYECARGADVMVVVTEWSQFRALDLARLKKEMAGSVVIDLRNIYSPQEMEVCGFIYEGVGRGASALQFRSGRVRPDISNVSVDVLFGVPGSKMSESGQSRRFDGAPIKEADTQDSTPRPGVNRLPIEEFEDMSLSDRDEALARASAAKRASAFIAEEPLRAVRASPSAGGLKAKEK